MVIFEKSKVVHAAVSVPCETPNYNKSQPCARSTKQLRRLPQLCSQMSKYVGRKKGRLRCIATTGGLQGRVRQMQLSELWTLFLRVQGCPSSCQGHPMLMQYLSDPHTGTMVSAMP